MLNEMPIHPLLAHFPIALFIAGVISQLIAIWKNDVFDRMATYLYLGGFVGGIATYLTGEDGEKFVKGHFPGDLESLVSPHETFALWTLVVFGIILVVKLLPWFNKYSQKLLPLVLLLSLVGAGLLVETGHYGGKIVYQSQLGDQHSVTKADQDQDED